MSATPPFKKLAMFTDQHYGRSGNSHQANQDNLDFLEWFIDQAKTWGADTIVLGGDWHDNRFSLNVSTMDYSLRGLERLSEEFDNVYAITGNHDLYYRDKRDVSSTSWSRHIKNITPIIKPTTFGEGKNAITILPWLVGDEYKTLKSLKSRYVFGHLELPGFLMNAKIEMPTHGSGITSDDIKDAPGIEYVFSGHFHFRQAKDKVVYIGNQFPYNFADAGDTDRGMMFLEWGKEPFFKAWDDQPLFSNMKLSELIDPASANRMLKQKMTARVFIDLDITWEEAQYIKDKFVNDYGLRKVELAHQTKQEANQDFGGEVVFQSVDQIVVEGLKSVTSIGLKPDKLVEIYKSLPNF
jgi:DNA repair exonuclease SbcCD nuclease subunit